MTSTMVEYSSGMELVETSSSSCSSYNYGSDEESVVIIVAPIRKGKNAGFKRKVCDFCSEEYVMMVIDRRRDDTTMSEDTPEEEKDGV